MSCSLCIWAPLLVCAWGVSLLALSRHYCRQTRQLREELREARTLQEAQQRIRMRLEKIYESTPDVIVVLSVAREIYVDINPAFTRLMGFSRDETLGRSALALEIWGDLAQRDRFWDEFTRQGRVESMELTGRHKDGRLIQGMASAQPIVEDGEPCVLFVYRDLTEWRRLQAAAEAAQAEVAAAAAANAAKTQFLSRMSHELRTPLNAVLGFAQLLREAPLLNRAEARRERDQVEAIVNAGWHLLTLIDDVLDIARIESGHAQFELAPTLLGDVVHQTFELLRPQADAAGVELVAELSGRWTLTPVLSDKHRLRQVLVNLLSNGIKYNRPGGRVHVSAALAPEGGRLLFSVTDNGIGMSEQQLAHLFEPFNRLGHERGSIEGVGIGLVLTRSLLELMGASLSLKSEPGAGTTATLNLPLATLPTQDPLPQRPAAEQAAANSPRAQLLYIEDNRVNQQIVQQALEGWPEVQLHLAGTATEGLRMAQAISPDLILLDMLLPDADGLDVLARLQADPALRALKVVALSASAMPEEVERARAGGALEYWTKPIRLAGFLADLRRVLG